MRLILSHSLHLTFPYMATSHNQKKLSLLPKELCKLFINNELVDSLSGKKFPTVNPATEEIIVEVSESLAEDVDAAVKAANEALIKWRKVSPKDRY